MTQSVTYTGMMHGHPTLQQRLREAGVLLVVCSESGDLVGGPSTIGYHANVVHNPATERRNCGAACREDDWLVDMFMRSGLVRGALRRAAGRWSGEDEPGPVEAFPGLWLVPIPLMSRRRRTGYSVALMPTADLLGSEHLAAICQSSRMDMEVANRLVLALPPTSPQEMGRLVMLIRALHEDHARLAADEQAIEQTGQQLAESYEEISLLYTIIQSMTVVQQPERFVEIACEELLGTLPYAWIGAQLSDDRERLKKLAGRFVMAGTRPGDAEPDDSFRRLARSLLATAQPDAPLVLEPEANSEHAKWADLGATVLVHPVTSDGKVLGILIAGEKQGADRAASSVDIKLLGATASHMAIFLENAALYDDLNAMFLGTLEALTASIDAKDRYTCGHSQRVAHLTQELARRAGYDETVVKRMHIAGLVHDVGKIGVPESVLLKPGKLTEEEFGWIRKHPEMGYRILKDIPQLRDLLPGVLYHHERWDGNGYPAGLIGEEIPKIARLIGLADAFDAMSSNRTYRSAMSRPEVLNEISRCAGTQFDPELVPLFVDLDFAEYDRLVIEHKAGDHLLPARNAPSAADISDATSVKPASIDPPIGSRKSVRFSDLVIHRRHEDGEAAA